MKISQYVRIYPEQILLNGHIITTESTGAEMLVEVYRKKINDYPKFFKMDDLSRLGFIASELLLQNEKDRLHDSEHRAIMLFNSSSSIDNDRRYQKTIDSLDNYYPSPSLFVYTLPNIVAGEIAIRNKYYGETSFYVLDKFDARIIWQTVDTAFCDADTTSVMCGWLECDEKDTFDVCMFIVGEDGDSEFNIENINKQYNNR